MVATGNAHYLDPDDAPLHDVLTCIRHRVPLTQAGDLLRSNSEYVFRSPQELAALFAEWPEALRATLDIAERCHARLPIGPQTLPAVPTPGGIPPIVYLRQLCQIALNQQSHSSAATSDEYQAALDHELRIIEEQGLTNYFLIVHDLVRFARSRNILCQGRGSAANSLVAYLLGITPIDPLSIGLVFERFLSAERATAPDIDIDFAAGTDREIVIQYLYQKYGHDHAAMACTVVTFGAKQAVRDVGMALGFSAETIDRVSDALDVHAADDSVVTAQPASDFRRSTRCTALAAVVEVGVGPARVSSSFRIAQRRLCDQRAALDRSNPRRTRDDE